MQNQGLLFDAISGAIYGPNSNGATGYVAKAASPYVSNQIGQYYKELAGNQNGELTNGQQTGHILAHGILGAAVSYATGNDALTGGLSASTGEASAPILSNFLYGTSDPSKLTAEQKDTISSITSALGTGIGATTGNASDSANAAETSKVAVENNQMLVPQAYDKLTAKEKQLYDKLERRKAPELTAFLETYNNCNSNICRDKAENLYQKASEQFGQIVLKMVEEGDLSLAEMQILTDNLANKFAKAADGEKGTIASLETNHWSPVGVIGYSQNLDKALALARHNYLVNEKGLTGKALANALSKDEVTQLLSLGLPIYTGVGSGPTKVNSNKTTNDRANNSARTMERIKAAERVSTASPNKTPPQVTAPRNVEEQILWNQVVNNPKAGRRLQNMNNDTRFPIDAGFQKMEANIKRADGRNTTIHYQYNTRTNKAYDIKITTDKNNSYSYPAEKPSKREKIK